MSRYLITGASGGLGSCIAAMLHTQNHVVLTMGRPGSGSHIEADLADYTPQEVCDEITASVIKGAPFDGIVHCAGAEVVQPLRGHSMRSFAYAMAAMHSAFGILMAAADGAVVKGGSIVLLSSVAAHRGVSGMVAYSAGKAAIEGMVRGAALELRRRQVRVNAVAPGAFRSPMHDRITRTLTEDGQREYAAKHPLGIGSREHVAEVCLQLLQAGWWQTGSTVIVDGGFLAG